MSEHIIRFTVNGVRREQHVAAQRRLIDVLRDVAAARSAGYDALHKLPDVALLPPFRFGRRSRSS